MRIAALAASLALTILLSACATRSAPVPLVGVSSDIDALVGEWVGEYSSTETRRSGSIRFTLAARGDTAYGDVVMIPTGWTRPLQPWREESPSSGDRPRPLPTVLTISFVRVAGNEVSGALEPYRDPDCSCALYTRFVGRLQGDAIEGTYFSHHSRSTVEAQGRWKVTRQPAAGR